MHLWVDAVYFYTAPPYVSSNPVPDEIGRKSKYDRFIGKLRTIPNFFVREGRLQKINGEFTQKGVDTLLTMDLMTAPFERNVRKIVVLACDTDFVPVLQSLRDRGIEVILYYYSDFVRRSEFSMSNYILTACDKPVLLQKEDFEKSLRKK